MTQGKGVAARLTLIAALVFGAAVLQPAYATSGGIDTPSGISDLPIAIHGTEVIDITSTGITVPGATGTLNANTLSALVNLVNLAPCGGSGIAKTSTTTYSCSY